MVRLVFMALLICYTGVLKAGALRSPRPCEGAAAAEVTNIDHTHMSKNANTFTFVCTRLFVCMCVVPCERLLG